LTSRFSFRTYVRESGCFVGSKLAPGSASKSVGNDILADASKPFAFEKGPATAADKAGFASNVKLRGASNSDALDKVDGLR
jgi:hypothetical protein